MNKKAFTLVELLIVITILAILGLISFISIQGFTTDARDAKRISDVISLLDKITIENTKGVNYFELIEQTTKTGTLLKINGEPRPGEQNIKNGVNFQVLKENAKDFRDPLNGHPYPFAYAEGNAGGMGYSFVQLAYVEEKTGTTKLVGNYYEMLPGDSPSLFIGCITNSKKELENNDCPIYDILVSDEANSSSNGGNPQPTTPITCEYGAMNIEGEKGVFPGANDDIIIRDGNGCGYIIADKNVGAETNDISLCTTSSCPTSIAGNYYQWGRNNVEFTKGNADWGSNHNSWGGVNDTERTTDTSTNTGLRKGPCPPDWHVPSIAEWMGLTYMYLNNVNVIPYTLGTYYWNEVKMETFMSELRLPMAGQKNWNNGNMYNQGTDGYYWSSSPSGATNGFEIWLNNTYVKPYDSFRATGFLVRCFKNQIN